jgi:hypothetical protein
VHNIAELGKTKRTPKEAARSKLGRKIVLLFYSLEEELVKYILLMEEKFYGLTRNDLRKMAYALASRNGIKHPSGLSMLVGRT